jgi:putative nucleotidyltransferase with HDIG domain
MTAAIPTIPECFELMEQYRMLANIRLHSVIVTRVAETIVKSLRLPPSNGATPPDIDLVTAGALLHDIAKTKCLDGSCRHAEEGQEICNGLGYPAVGRIVREHVILSSFHTDDYRNGNFPAREIIYYSDKRVRHDEIVSLDDRLAYIIERYGDGTDYVEQRIRANFVSCLELEEYLFSYIDFAPDELGEHLVAGFFEAAEANLRRTLETSVR